MTMFDVAFLDSPEAKTAILVFGTEVGVIGVDCSASTGLIIHGWLVEKGTVAYATGFA